MSPDRHGDFSGSIVHNVLVKKKNNPFRQWIKVITIQVFESLQTFATLKQVQYAPKRPAQKLRGDSIQSLS
jgi:hypothetical protein